MACNKAQNMKNQITNLLVQRGYSPQEMGGRIRWLKEGKRTFTFATTCDVVDYRFDESGPMQQIRHEGAINKLMEWL